MKDEYDLAIVGGGPAGSACALAAARRGASVVLFEAQRSMCDKPCGEGLLPPGVDALRELGVEEVLENGQAFDRLRYVVPALEPLEIPLPRPGMALDRPSLTSGLEAALQRTPGIDRAFGRVEVDRRDAGSQRSGFRLSTGTESTRATVLVVADGINGKCAPWLRGTGDSSRVHAPSGQHARFGVRARFSARTRLDAVEVHFCRGSEVYLTPLPGNRINVAILVSGHHVRDGGAEAVLARALAEHPRAAQKLSTRITAPEGRLLGSSVPTCVARERTFLIGDAGGGIDPILGCGVTLALETGLLAAKAAAEILAGDDSGAPEQNYAMEYRRRTQTRRALAKFLIALSQRPLLARGTLGLARFSPGLLEALVGIATKSRESVLPRLAAG